MNHDPLCPAAPSPVNVIRDLIASAPGGVERLEAARQRRVAAAGDWCQCELIAKVRDDQDRRNAARQLTREAQDMGMIP